MRGAFVYIMSNRHRRIYVGSTVNLPVRVAQHKRKHFPNAFTARYQFYRLVWFEACATLTDALSREKKVKGWTRAKKVALIQAKNPNWKDLSATWGELLMTE